MAEEGSGPTTSGLPVDVSKLGQGLRERAIRTFARVLGVTIGAPFVDHVRANLDTLDGRTIVRKMLAEEAGRRAIADPAIMDRAMERFLGTEYRKQENVEETLKETVEHLAEEAESAVSSEVDEDWLNLFSRQAEDASSDRMRDLLGRILAGQIRKPGAFSLSTLRAVSEMDYDQAADLQVLSNNLVNDTVVLDDSWESGDKLILSRRLASAGFCLNSAGELNLSNTIPGGALIIKGKSLALIVKTKAGMTMRINVLQISRTGVELCSLLSSRNEQELLRQIAAKLPNRHTIEIMQIAMLSPPHMVIETPPV